MARVLYLYSQALRTESPHARRTFQMLALLREAGFKPDLLTLPGGDPWPDGLAEHIYVTSRVPFTRSLRPYGFGFRRAWATVAMALTAVRLSLQHRYDIVHCSDRAIRVGGLIAWLFGTRFVFEWRSSSGHDLVKWARWRTARFRNAVSLVLTDTTYTVPQLRASGLYGKIASIQSLPLPALTPLPPPPVRDRATVQPFRITALSYTGKLQDLTLFCDALPHLLHFPNIHITIAGGTPAAIEHLRQRLCRRFPHDSARLHLRANPVDVADFTDAVATADLVFLPVCSGIVAPPTLLDVMALGRAILAIRCPAYNTLLTHQNAALINADTQQLVDAVHYHLHAPTLCIDHARAVQETIQRERNATAAVAALRSCYTFILLEPQS
ncbi:MAG: glycosyltransferase [Kiritimatiellae bacterium]|nr:glycosyltransferase [Kiritimatiellia bacterium]